MSIAALKAGDVKFLVVHCSATPAKQDLGVADIDRMHRLRGFLKVGYHYVIKRSGEVQKGRPEHQRGAHVEGHNAESLGICLIGGVDPKLKPEDNFTYDQKVALMALLVELKGRYPQATVCGHRDFPGVAKACPCFDVKAWFGES